MPCKFSARIFTNPLANMLPTQQFNLVFFARSQTYSEAFFTIKEEILMFSTVFVIKNLVRHFEKKNLFQLEILKI